MQFKKAVYPLFVLAAVFYLGACGQAENKSAPQVGFKVEKEAPKPVQAAAEEDLSDDAPRKVFKPFKVYTDANSPDNHFAPSGWMGDWGDIKLNVSDMDNAHSGATAIKIVYTAEKTKKAGWTGIYWQNPPNNWGGQRGGYDLTGATKLTFWARGEKGGEKIEEFRSGGIPGEFADSDVAGIGPIALTKDWKQYEIDLTDKDLTSISGGFMWSANVDGNPAGFTIYLDDIKYE